MTRQYVAAAVAAALLSLVPSSAHADRVPVDEGGDTAPCVTFAEYTAATLGTPQRRVRRIFDTYGQRTSPAVLDAVAGIITTGPNAEVARPTHRTVRLYLSCPDETTAGGMRVYVEFNTRTDRVTATLWTGAP